MDRHCVTGCLRQRQLNWVEQRIGHREGNTEQRRHLTPAGGVTESSGTVAVRALEKPGETQKPGPGCGRSGEPPQTTERGWWRRGPPLCDRPGSEEPQETGPGSQDRRGGLLRGSGNILWPEGRQGARREWVWRTCPPKWAEGKRKPLQEEGHSTGQVSEEVGDVGRGQHRMGCYRQWCSGEG